MSAEHEAENNNRTQINNSLHAQPRGKACGILGSGSSSGQTERKCSAYCTTFLQIEKGALL